MMAQQEREQQEKQQQHPRQSSPFLATNAIKIHESPLRDKTKKNQDKRKMTSQSSHPRTESHRNQGSAGSKSPEQFTMYNTHAEPQQTTSTARTTRKQSTFVDRIINKLFPSHHYFITRRPRDWWAGLIDAISNVQRGCWQALCGLVDAGWDGYSLAGLPGLLGGSMYGLAQGVLLATTGVATGLYQFVVGLSNTPGAIQESSQGKTWDDDAGHWYVYSLDVEDKQVSKEIAAEISSKPSRHQVPQFRQRLHHRKVKDQEFYRLLKVSTDASQSEIKRAYYREALRTHPDKNMVDSSRASQRFQQLSLAYKTLHNQHSRDAYDQMGRCFVESRMENNQQHLDSHTFFAVMFGSYLVEPYIGELKVASMVDTFLQATDTNRLNHHGDYDITHLLKQKRRVLDIAIFLRGRIERFVFGKQSEAEFQASCQLEALSIAKGDFGDSFLISIGRSLVVEGKRFLGKHTSALGLSGAAVSIQAATDEMVESYQTIVALVQSVASWTGPVMEAFFADSKRQKKQADSDGHTADSKENIDCGNDPDLKFDTMLLIDKLERGLPQAVRFVWQLNDRDIRQTLKDATDRLLRDGASYEIRLMRARGLVILGNEFYKTGMQLKRKDRWLDSDALKRSMGNAFEAAVHPVQYSAF